MKAIQLYVCGDFNIQTLLMDMEFEIVTDLIPLVQIKISTTNKHVGEVKKALEPSKNDVKAFWGHHHSHISHNN